MSEGIYYGADNPVPGGAREQDQRMCGRYADSRLFLLAIQCTRAAGHEGWHQAGIEGGLMIAEWIDNDPS